MKRKTILAAAALVSLAAPSFAAPNAYFSIASGVSAPMDSHLSDYTGDSADVSYKPGYTFSGAYGSIINDFRLEIELTYKAADLDQFKYRGLSAPVKSNAICFASMVNGYYDIPTGTAFVPYVGAGFGAASVRVDNGYSKTGALLWTSEVDTVVAYQLAAGIEIKASEKLAFDFGYRYFGTSEAKFGLSTADFQSNNFQVGLQFRF